MSRKLIIDGNAVYEIDENCMLKKRLDGNGKEGSRAPGGGTPEKIHRRNRIGTTDREPGDRQRIRMHGRPRILNCVKRF